MEDISRETARGPAAACLRVLQCYDELFIMGEDLLVAGGRSSGDASTSGQSSSRRSPSQDFRLAAVRPGDDQGSD